MKKYLYMAMLFLLEVSIKTSSTSTWREENSSPSWTSGALKEDEIKPILDKLVCKYLSSYFPIGCTNTSQPIPIYSTTTNQETTPEISSMSELLQLLISETDTTKSTVDVYDDITADPRYKSTDQDAGPGGSDYQMGPSCRPDTRNDCTRNAWACTSTRYPWFRDACPTTCNTCGGGGGGNNGWGQWEAWSRCSRTCGPGTQTRRRRCSGSNCSGSDEEQRECRERECREPTGCPRRRRKNVASLTSSERQRLQRALREAIASTTPWRNYRDVANLHGRPAVVCPRRQWGVCCPHGNLDFLPWHRLFMVQAEQMLGEALPYWDWTESSTVPDLWGSIRAPFKQPQISSGTRCQGRDRTHHRRARNIRINSRRFKRLTQLALEETTFERFSDRFEEPHNELHGAMGCDMSPLTTSAYDPIFYVHHTFIDYIFAYWQELQRLRGLPVSVRSSRLEPFHSQQFNPYDITRNNRRPESFLNYRNTLCYEYENLVFDGKTPQQFLGISGQDYQEGSEGAQGEEFRVFVAIAMPKIAPTTEVTFDVCNKENTCVNGGIFATFGPLPSEVPKESYQTLRGNKTNLRMAESEVTHLGIFKRFAKVGSEGTKIVFDTESTAKITSTDELGIMSGLEPVLIWRKVSQGVKGGEAHLLNEAKRGDDYEDIRRGSKKEEYGNLLKRYETVVENGQFYKFKEDGKK